MSLAAGKLRHQVELQEFVEILDSNGDRETFWGHVAFMWASVEPLSAKEFIAAQQMQSKVTARITIRRRSDINAGMRILFRDQYYNIEGVLSDPVSGLEYQTLPCSSGIMEPTDTTIVMEGGP